MKIQQSTLLKALQRIHSATLVSLAYPQLENYQFVTTASKLSLAATNLQIYIKTIVDVSESTDLAVLINAKDLMAYISKLPEQPLAFEFGKNEVTISYAGGSFKLPTDNCDLFPQQPATKTKQTLVLPGAILKQGLEKTVWAIAKDRKDMPAAECLNISLTPGVIGFNSGDGFKISTFNYPCEHKIAADLLIPTAAIPALDLPDTDLSVIVDGSSISFIYEQTTVVVRLGDGQFPNFLPAIPNEHKAVAKFDKQQLLDAVSRVSMMAERQNKTLRLSFADTLTITAENTDRGQKAEESMGIDYTGEPITVGINGDDLFNALRKCDGYIGLTSPTKPVVIGEGRENIVLLFALPLRS